MVLDYMKRNGSITQKDAINEFGCYRLSGRIYDLRKLGHEIIKSTECMPNRYGVSVTYARYRLKEA